MADVVKNDVTPMTETSSVARQLRHLWQQGIDSGPPEPLKMVAIKRKARARFAVGGSRIAGT